MILLICLLFILSLVLLVLIWPLSYQLDLSYRQSVLQFSFTLANYCYGLLFKRQDQQTVMQAKLFGFIRPFARSTAPNKADPAPEPSAEPPTARRPGFIKTIIKNRTLKPALLDLAQGIWKVIFPRKMLIKARIGFSEPHYTGWLMAVAGMLQAASPSYDIQLEGIWDEAWLEGEIIISGRIMPARLLWQILKFIIKPEIRSAYKRLRAQEKPPPQKAAA